MQVSWIEAEDLKGLLARIALPENAPSAPTVAEKPVSLLAELEDPFLITSLDAPVPDPFDAVAPAAAFVDSQPALPEKPVTPAPPLPPAPVSTSPGAPAPLPHEAPAADQAPAILPLSRIRDKLRAIRQRAHDAGILAKGSEAKARAAFTPPGQQRSTPEAEPAPSSAIPLSPEAVYPSAAPSLPAAPASEPAMEPLRSAEPPLPPPLPAFEAPTGNVEERLSAFAAWAGHALPDEEGHLLVMNDQGQLLWGGEAKASLVLSAMMAWSAARRSSAHTACGDLPIMRQALASGHRLTVIACETTPGTRLHIAVAAPRALADSTALELQKALVETMRGMRG